MAIQYMLRGVHNDEAASMGPSTSNQRYKDKKPLFQSEIYCYEPQRIECWWRHLLHRVLHVYIDVFKNLVYIDAFDFSEQHKYGYLFFFALMRYIRCESSVSVSYFAKKQPFTSETAYSGSLRHFASGMSSNATCNGW